MKSTIFKTLGTACFAFALTTGANAEVLVNFTFDSDSAASSDTSIYSSASTWDLTNSAAQNSITGGVSSVLANHNTETVPDAPGGTPGISATTVDASNAGSQWQQFDFTVTGLGLGETLNLTSFVYDYNRIQPLNFESGVYSNLSGYTGLSDSLGGSANFSGAGSSLVSPNITLSGSEFQGLTNGTLVEFRIYLKDPSQNVNSRIHQLDNIVLNGTVIPEPSSFALLGGLMAFSAVALKRRRA
jgi:hypothetical protein